jgi:hypothetical protein
MTFHPLLVFVLSFIALAASAYIGAAFHRMGPARDEDFGEDLNVILGATLTLLGLVIGFAFSMAINRYDQRKNLEEAEANAIGTEFLRADLLPAGDAAKVREQLRNYLDQRILFYVTRDEMELQRISVRTSQLQAELWSLVRGPATAEPNPIGALVVAGMNDVLNAQGYTQAAWWNRIPAAAWGLMASIAVCGNLLVGYRSISKRRVAKRFLVLPLVISIAFMLIADIDAPRAA